MTTNQFQSSVTPTSHPLVANYTLTIPDGSQVSVEFGLDTSYGLLTWQIPAPAGGGTVSLFVAGMLPTTQYHMRALVQLQNGTTVPDDDHVFTTLALPSTSGLFPDVKILTPGSWSPGVELTTMVHPNRIVLALDVNGNVMWYYNNPADDARHVCAFALKLLPNGHWLGCFTNRYSHDPIRYGCVREVDLAGNTVLDATGQLRQLDLLQLNEKLVDIRTPQGSKVRAEYFSHDLLPLPNGHVIVLCQEFRTVDGVEVWGDILVDLDENFDPVWVWSGFDHLQISRHPMGLPDWTHSNAVVATPDGNILLSVRDQSWVLKLDYANGTGTGNIIWKLGFEGDFEFATGPASWFFAQHYPCIFATSGADITTLSVVDNGNYRVASDPPMYSRALILSIDEPGRQAAIAWQYPISPDYFSNWGGNVVHLLNGDIEICMSIVTPQSSLVTEVNYSTKQIVWQMQVSPPNAYRSYRIPSLYPGVQWS